MRMVFCPLRFEFDPEAVMADLEPIIPQFMKLSVAERPLRPENRREHFMVADDEHYDNVDHHRDGVHVPGKYTSLEGINLRHLPGVPRSIADSVRFRIPADEPWEWNPKFVLRHIPDIIDRLPLTKLRSVRVLSIPEGGFLPVHQDAFNTDYWDAGHTTLTLQIRTGGVAMIMKTKDGLREIDCPAFFFRDSVPHGVPVVKDRRVLLRISGKADKDRLDEMLVPESAIYE